MGISVERARRHVNENCSALRSIPQNANWPKCLFHAAHAETARDILVSGRLSPRNLLGHIAHDVANQGALWNNDVAHNYARLYFRPKSGFHLRTEGIKCLGDQYRLPCQMSIPIMFVFDAISILSLTSTCFTDRNFDHQIEPGNDEGYFDAIPFADVYHDRPPGNRKTEIHDRRMVEVVYPDHLPLSGHLEQIICRTALDKDTLLTLLGKYVDQFRSIITVEQIHGSTFFHDGLYIKNIGFSKNRMHVTLKPPKHLPPSGEYRVHVERITDGKVDYQASGSVKSDHTAFTVSPSQGKMSSIFRIMLEDVLAFLGPVSTKQSEVF